jgi:hypothetical protein
MQGLRRAPSCTTHGMTERAPRLAYKRWGRGGGGRAAAFRTPPGPSALGRAGLEPAMCPWRAGSGVQPLASKDAGLRPAPRLPCSRRGFASMNDPRRTTTVQQGSCGLYPPCAHAGTVPIPKLAVRVGFPSPAPPRRPLYSELPLAAACAGIASPAVKPRRGVKQPAPPITPAGPGKW